MNSGYLKCIGCGEEYSTSDVLYRCRVCGDILDVRYRWADASMNPGRLKQMWLDRRTSFEPFDYSGVWRFREMLPFWDSEGQLLAYPEGNTYLLDAPRCARYVGLRRLQIKHLGFNPTGSFKDYGMAAAITQAGILGMRAVACASTGNTSASMAAYAARAGMLAIVIIPDQQISAGKLSQALDYNALTLQIDGDFDDAQKAVLEIAPELGIYVVNSVNPFRPEGQKTVMLEMLEQLGWQVPDRIVVPGGNLGNSSAFGKGLQELHDLGFIDRLPSLTIVQAQGADPLYRTVLGRKTGSLTAVHAKTLATAIKIGNPVSWRKALRALELTDGWVTEVSEGEIASAKAVIGADGVGCEPASATTVAGLKRILAEGTDGPVSSDEHVVAILTGHVLKDPDYTTRYHRSELYEDVEEETVVRGGAGKLDSVFANPPVKVKLDRDAIRREVEDGMRRLEGGHPAGWRG